MQIYYFAVRRGRGLGERINERCGAHARYTDGAEQNNSARIQNKIYILLKYLFLDIKCDACIFLILHMCIFIIAVTVNQM